MKWIWLTSILLLAGCTGEPKGMHPVKGFDAQRFMGHWNEIARLDHNFEYGLTDVTMDYRKLPDGRIELINRGFDAKHNRWNETKGIAHFKGRRDVASLDISLFWPFSGEYNVLVLDPEYHYAMVAGPNKNYLWILARSQQLDSDTLSTLVDRAKEWGFATDALIYVEHKKMPIKVN